MHAHPSRAIVSRSTATPMKEFPHAFLRSAGNRSEKHSKSAVNRSRSSQDPNSGSTSDPRFSALLFRIFR